MDKVQISVVLTYCLYFNKADFHTCEGTSRESDIESPSDGSGAFLKEMKLKVKHQATQS